MDLKELVKDVRKEFGRKAEIYDYFGNIKGHKTLPLYYSDTQKLCFPELYYYKEKMVEIKSYIEEKLSKEIILEENTWIGGLHCRGYIIRL